MQTIVHKSCSVVGYCGAADLLAYSWDRHFWKPRYFQLLHCALS